MMKLFRVDARPRILDFNPDMGRTVDRNRVGPDRKHPLPLHGLESVIDQVEKGLLQLVRVSHHLWKGFSELFDKLDPLVIKPFHDHGKAVFQDLPNVRERTMFGSDFDVLYFTEPGMTIERYYKRFLDLFGGERLAQMASRVPLAFLGLEPS